MKTPKELRYQLVELKELHELRLAQYPLGYSPVQRAEYETAVAWLKWVLGDKD